MKPEEKARQKIDQLLTKAGWTIQDREQMNLRASQGVAVREFPMSSGPTDYLLFVDGSAVGVIEAKPEGTTLSGVSDQTEKYLRGVPLLLPSHQNPYPLATKAQGLKPFSGIYAIQTPAPAAFLLSTSQRPCYSGSGSNKHCDTISKRYPYWRVKDYGLSNRSDRQSGEVICRARPRALIQMATGSGKTYTAVSFVYRLIKRAKAERILFLVDRSNLGRQTLKEFQQYTTPDDGRKFTELYNVQHLTTNRIDGVSKVCITTIQRLYSMLKGDSDFDEENESESLLNLDSTNQPAAEVEYNPKIPISTFDFIITDECHRSIYHRWRPVLEYFDAFLVGLTATPSKQTLGFFNQNLVTEYPHERAVADGVNVGYDVYRIKTEIAEDGSKIPPGFYVDKRDKLTRRIRLELLDEEMEYSANQLDRDVVAPDQIRKVIQTFRDNLFTEIFPGRKHVPKTLIFAKDDSHAEDILRIVRREFGKGNDFCKKITYRTTGDTAEHLLASFRNSYDPRIAVTVDMVATGTDIKPLECIIFMRSVRSPVYFEQMKGRGTRTISSTDLQAVTPDAHHKTHFVIVDAVGVCENDKTDSRPLERKRSVPFEKLLEAVALGDQDPDTLTSLAGRLARLDREIGDDGQKQITEASEGISLQRMVHALFDAIDPDKHQLPMALPTGVLAPEHIRLLLESPAESLTPEQIQARADWLTAEACKPFDDPDLRNTLIELEKQQVQTVDTVSQDNVTFAGFDAESKARAEQRVASFKRFIEDNRDELTAIQILYSQPYGQRHLTYQQVQQLAEAIKQPPYGFTTEELWGAYERLDQSKVKGAGPDKLLMDIISLVRFAIGETATLEPYKEIVDQRFQVWLADQERSFSEEQMVWLEMIKDHIATSLRVEMDDFENIPFQGQGGAFKVYQLFGDTLDTILETLNEGLAA